MSTTYPRNTNQSGVVYADTSEPGVNASAGDSPFPLLVSQTPVGYLDEDYSELDVTTGEYEAFQNTAFFTPTAGKLNKRTLGFPYQYVIPGYVGGHPSGRTLQISTTPEGRLALNFVSTGTYSQYVNVYLVPAQFNGDAMLAELQDLEPDEHEQILLDALSWTDAKIAGANDAAAELQRVATHSAHPEEELTFVGTMNLLTNSGSQEEFSVFVLIASD